MKNLSTQKLNKKMIPAILCSVIIFGTTALTGCQPKVEHVDANKDHKCDCGCTQTFGSHADADFDHVCDYGCQTAVGVCEDADKNHECDYGCDVVIGEHADADKNHKCDYGCKEAVGKCEDTDSDHKCDYGCGQTFGECADADKDHACDYGCDAVIGEHADADKDHACDYGCNEAIGECSDADKDHACDYGCDAAIGECTDADKDHACDYGCDAVIGEHTDADKDHACDYGCAEFIGVCADGNKDHKCDDGCTKTFGEHADANKDHACDYGCNEAIGECADANKDHVCDYGCGNNFGEHADANKDHTCDYGCGKAYGECADANKDHTCDYGCGQAYGECADANKDHTCDYGCGKAYGTHADENNDHACDYGCDAVIGEHATAANSHNCAYCNATMTVCDDQNNDFKCDICGKDLCTDHVEATKEENRKEASCKVDGSYELVTYCSNCGAEINRETKVIPKNDNHVPADAIKENEVAGDCNSNGTYEAVVNCSVCGIELSREDKVEENSATGIHIDANGDLVCDGCGEVQFYVITLDGATATADNAHTSSVPNAFVEGTNVTLTADTYKTVDGKTYMFVGFDLNAVDNRIADNGSTSVTYTMPAKAVSITAKYAEANTTFFASAAWQSGSNYNSEGMSATAINNSADPDLEGLSGWSFTIPDNAAATTSTTNNLTAVPFTAWGIDSDKLVRFVLKNTGNYDVTVELYAEYFGFMVSTGNVTVPANSVVVAFMDFGPFSGVGTTCDFGMHIRENMTGDGTGTIQLDVVASAAKKYETKVSDFIVTSDKNVFMDFGESNESNTQANIAHASASGMNMRYWDEYGVMYFYGNNNTSADTYARERANAIGGNAIDLTNGEKITIYVKVTNLYHGGGGKYSLVFTRGSSALSGSYLATQVIEFSEYGESYVYKIEIDPTKAGSSANLQFGLKKAMADGTGGKVDVLVQIASENIFGEDPVN